jgi:hypothetical protein
MLIRLLTLLGFPPRAEWRAAVAVSRPRAVHPIEQTEWNGTVLSGESYR